MTFWDFFKRRKIGPLSASPVELIIFCLLIAGVWRVADGVYRDKAIQNGLYAAINFARPIVIQAYCIHDQTGEWPRSLDDLRIGQETRSPQIAQIQLLRDQGVRLVFASPEVIAGKSMMLRVNRREDGHFLECEAKEIPQGPLPPICKWKDHAERLSWPPTMPNNALQSPR